MRLYGKKLQNATKESFFIALFLMIEKFNGSQFLINPEIKISESVSGTLQYV